MKYRNIPLKRILSLILCLLALQFACAEAGTPMSVCEINKYGSFQLSISATDFLSAGYSYGDIASVEINGKTYDMPVCSAYTDVAIGEPIICLNIDPEADLDVVYLALNTSSLAEDSAVAQKVLIDEAPGYRWEFADGIQWPLPIQVTMKEARGYYDEWSVNQLERTNSRDDYAHLSDTEFANFRPVTTTGMGEGALYRSSSPVNPEIGRNAYANAAAEAAGVRTVMNLANSKEEMESYEGYAGSYYSTCNVIPLNLAVDFAAEDFEAGLAAGVRFFIANEGPYLVHCNEGKDRAGFTSAILECLMGASADEVLDDYMVTYYNYYGVLPDTKQYDTILNNNIKKSLEIAFDIEDLRAEGLDLSAEAREYMADKLQLTDEEIHQLYERLS